MRNGLQTSMELHRLILHIQIPTEYSKKISITFMNVTAKQNHFCKHKEI